MVIQINAWFKKGSQFCNRSLKSSNSIEKKPWSTALLLYPIDAFVEIGEKFIFAILPK